uniref:eCIS core domain-containing protein n=1 Tax=Algoriphagus sp. TaxID=1872435 RepID=UPI004047069D
MGEFSSQADQKNKTVTPAPVPEEISSTGELEYVDTRASTAQLISLQAAADGRGNRSNTAQLQTKALSYAGNSRIAQLQALSDSRTTTAKTNPIQRQENKTGLPDQLKTGMESISGLSLSDVKVHRNSDKPAQLQAHAYAQGTDIHLGPGQEKHLPHELGHVVQQKEGRVKPTVQLKGKVNINDDAGLEKEADVLGAKALQGKFINSDFSPKQLAISSSNQPFQLLLGEGEERQAAEVRPAPADGGSDEWTMEPFEEVVKDEEDHLHLFIFHEDRLVTYLENFNKFLDELSNLELSDSKKAAENLKALYRLEVLSTILNSAGVVLGLSAIGVFSTVTAGLGPAAVGVGVLGSIATHTSTGIIASALGLATDAAKEYVKSKDVDKSLSQGKSTFQELALNATGNDVAGLGKAVGKGAGMEGGAKALGGVVAAQLGGIFAAIGLRGNNKALAEMMIARKTIASDFKAFSETLNVLKSELIMKSSELQGTAHSSQISEEDQTRIVEMVGSSTSKIDSALKGIHKSLASVKTNHDLFLRL